MTNEEIKLVNNIMKRINNIKNDIYKKLFPIKEYSNSMSLLISTADLSNAYRSIREFKKEELNELT